MAVRKIVPERHRIAASYLLDGQSAFKALTRAGFSKWTARRFGELLRSSWALREAIRQEEERRQHYLRPAPKRAKRYDRRPIALDVRNLCFPEDRQAISNRPVQTLYGQERIAQRIAAGLPPKEQRKESGFEHLTNCPGCGKRVSVRKLFLNFSQTGYVCGQCARV